MPDVITATEYLDIAGIPLATPAWRIIDLSQLREEAEQRGQDRLLPGTAGVIAYPRRRTVTLKQLPMVIFGDRNREDTPYADVAVGLQANIDALNDGIVAPPGTASGTRTATWHLPDGTTTRTADVHVLALRLGRRIPELVYAVLEFSIPTGRFT